MKKRLLAPTSMVIVTVASVLGGAAPQASGQTVIGSTHVVEGKDTPHPYPLAQQAGQIVWSETIRHEGAGLIKVLFDDYALAAGDYMTVRDADSDRVDRYDTTRVGRFWSTAIFSDTVVIELHSAGRAPGYGFRITGYAEGPPFQPCAVFALCGVDVQCPPAQGGPPKKVAPLRRAVCAIVTVGAVPGDMKSCSGYQIDWDQNNPINGFVLTNNHCRPPNGWADAEVWFNGELDGCPPDGTQLKSIAQYHPTLLCCSDCKSSFPCNTCLREPNAPPDPLLDYALLSIVPAVPMLPDASFWGKLALRDAPPVPAAGIFPGETVYRFHHSFGCQKQYTCGVVTGPSPATHPDYWEYSALGAPGSSGSPVIAQNDLSVILHHGYGGTGAEKECDKGKGSQMSALIADMTAQNCLPASVELTGPACPWDCINQDRDVNLIEFLGLLSQWGGPGTCDFDGGGVGITDFLELLAHRGPCYTPC